MQHLKRIGIGVVRGLWIVLCGSVGLVLYLLCCYYAMSVLSPVIEHLLNAIEHHYCCW